MHLIVDNNKHHQVISHPPLDDHNILSQDDDVFLLDTHTSSHALFHLLFPTQSLGTIRSTTRGATITNQNQRSTSGRFRRRHSEKNGIPSSTEPIPGRIVSAKQVAMWASINKGKVPSNFYATEQQQQQQQLQLQQLQLQPQTPKSQISSRIPPPPSPQQLPPPLPPSESSSSSDYFAPPLSEISAPSPLPNAPPPGDPPPTLP